MTRMAVRRWTVGTIAIVVSIVVFLVPFAFILVTAAKTAPEASALAFTLPTEWRLWENVAAVLADRDGILIRAFVNSIVLTVASVTIMVVLAAMVGYVLQRKASRWNPLINFFVLAGLIVPPAVVPTIWLMQGLKLFGTLHGMILIEVAYNLPFSIILYRAFVATIPRDLDEAAIIDGARPLDVFFRIILPMLWPVTVTNIVVQSVGIFNDFTNPLYYLPGNQNATVQLTLYNFQSQYNTSYNLLFTNILLITVPPLIVFLFFNRQIVAGMTAGAVKG